MSLRMLLSLTLMALLAAPLSGANPVGEWNCTATRPSGGDLPWSLKVGREDGKLVATVNSERGEMKLPQVKMDGDTLVLHLTLEEGDFEIRLAIDGDKMDGEWKNGDTTGKVKGARKVS